METAALIEKAALLVSNDSGPVHVATAVATPVLAIFGRSHRALGPVVWGPVGKDDKIVQKSSVDCEVCLAHECIHDFKCLKKLTVNDVWSVLCGMIHLGEKDD